MNVRYLNHYWLLGDGADEEAKRWVAVDEKKRILYSSPKAVELQEHGKYTAPHLPIPPEHFVIVVISDHEDDGTTLGISTWTGQVGWIGPSLYDQDDTESPNQGETTPPATQERDPDRAESSGKVEHDTPESGDSDDLLEELKRLP